MKQQSLLLGVALTMSASVGLPCGTANCPLVTQTQDGLKSKGAWLIDLGYRFMRQDGLTGVDAADTRPIAPLIDFESRGGRGPVSASYQGIGLERLRGGVGPNHGNE